MARTETISFVPNAVDLALYAGDEVSFTVVVTNPDGTQRDVSGLAIAQIRASRADTDPAATFTVDDTDAATGRLVLTLDPADSAALTTDGKKFTGFWDLQVANTTLVQGSVTCWPDVTH